MSTDALKPAFRDERDDQSLQPPAAASLSPASEPQADSSPPVQPTPATSPPVAATPQLHPARASPAPAPIVPEAQQPIEAQQQTHIEIEPQQLPSQAPPPQQSQSQQLPAPSEPQAPLPSKAVPAILRKRVSFPSFDTKVSKGGVPVGTETTRSSPAPRQHRRKQALAPRSCLSSVTSVTRGKMANTLARLELSSSVLFHQSSRNYSFVQ